MHHTALHIFLPFWFYKQTEEREALRKQSLNEKTAASVLLKLFISGNERCHTTKIENHSNHIKWS